MTRWTPAPTRARLHGARRALLEQAASALEASQWHGTAPEHAAMLRGKAKAYREAERILAAIEDGHKSTRLRRKARV